MSKQANKITIREAVTAAEEEHFWKEMHAYHIRDTFPDPQDEDREYFLGDDYRSQIQKIHDRAVDRCHYLLFDRDGEEIGFCLSVIYSTEDGKCFLMEFCVYPKFRGNGTGKECASVFLDWAKHQGAAYVELNVSTPERARFWGYSGFRANGRDEWGVPLMLRGPVEKVPFTVERLKDSEDWQLLKLMSGFLSDIGEECLTEEKQTRLQNAVREGRITFFLAKRGYRAVGMCSVVKSFSTFNCGSVGVFDDFYIEPVFRKQGIAGLLTAAAQVWCREQEIASLTVTCAPCDEEMYRHLGFQVPLGKTYAYIAEQAD